MGTLLAVQPHGGGAVDHDCEDGPLALVRGGGDGDVAGEDAGLGGGGVGDVQGNAGLVKGGLGDGVIAAHELELDHGALGGGDAIRGEGQGAVVGGDLNGLNRDGCVGLLVKLGRPRDIRYSH